MQDSTRSAAAERERASVQGSNGAATGRSRRRWSAEEKARVVRESLRPGERVGEVTRRYGTHHEPLTWTSVVHPAPRDGEHTRESNTEPPSPRQVWHPGSRLEGR